MNSWRSLFEAGPPGGEPMTFRVFSRGGHPLLIFPKSGRIPARWALTLYAPQTLVARLAASLWRYSLPWGFAPGSHTEIATVNSASPFLRFLANLAERGPADASRVPSFVILAGNPHAPAPRFLVQVFDAQHQPVAVVKTGFGPKAAALIGREADFLKSANAQASEQKLMGIPQVLGQLTGAEPLSGFAMPFVDGQSPSPSQAQCMKPILSSWVNRGKMVLVPDLPAWQRLALAASDHPLFKKLDARLNRKEIRPALYHGDFVPWNIKISPADRHWTVLDWERAEPEGPPGWDWFHYILQPAMLVQRLAGPALETVADALPNATGFRTYSKAAGLAGIERDWLLAYLLYCQQVLRPAEGSPGVDFLLSRG